MLYMECLLESEKTEIELTLQALTKLVAKMVVPGVDFGLTHA